MDAQYGSEAPVDTGVPKLNTAEGIAHIPALVSAVICVGLIRSGFLSFFFLVPLGVMAYSYNLRSVWASVSAAVLGNSMLSLGLVLFSTGTRGYFWLDMVYFAIMMLVFTWILAPPLKQPGFLTIPLAYRFIVGSVIGALAFFVVIKTAQDSFNAFLRDQGEMLSSLYIASAGTDVVQRSLLEASVNPEAIMSVISLVMLRGGGVASCALIFFASRQISLVFTWFIHHIKGKNGIIHFHAVPGLIWVLSFSLLGILLGTQAAIPPLEILAWNLLTICAILYLAQGGGIVWHFLSRRAMHPLMRLILNILVIILIFSPGINACALGLLILLGIAEHWVPFRAPKSDGPSSTPGM